MLYDYLLFREVGLENISSKSIIIDNKNRCQKAKPLFCPLVLRIEKKIIVKSETSIGDSVKFIGHKSFFVYRRFV